MNSLKKDSEYYSGKKKRHTIKAQVIADYQSYDILSVDFSGGKKHDFTLFKATHKIVSESTLILADRGYQGIAEFHKNTLTPIKKFNNKELVLQKKATTK